MTEASAEIEKLRALCPEAELWAEGALSLAYLPDLTIKKGAQQKTVDALLWPHARDNYPTRLFVSEQISWSVGGQWTQCAVQGRSWWACSWGGVDAGRPWLEILAGHLRAFQ